MSASPSASPLPPESLPTPPSAWIARFAPLVRPGGTVLDVACGGGRHLRLFHRLGHAVTGIDRDLGGVADLQGRPGIALIAADLEDGRPWPLPSRSFAGVVVANYLHRPLFPSLLDALEPGGVLIYETFSQGNARFGKPSSPAFLLRDGELLEVARGRLLVVAYEHGAVAAPRAAMVQRLCAVNAPEPPPLP